MKNRLPVYLLLGAAAVFAASAGFFVSQAFSAGTQAPTRTVTVSVENGATGPQGPKGEPGPPGPAGSISCPKGFSEGDLVINHPGGQVTLFTCLKD